MNSYKKIDVKTPLQPWGSLLEEWVSLVARLYQDTRGECSPYSYRERTNIGVLASAAIKVGWSALEECSSIKSGNGSGRGRLDLLLWKEWKDGLRYQVEAKLTCDSILKLQEKVLDRHGKAKADALKLPNRQGQRRVGLTFVIPRLSEDEDLYRVSPGLDELFEWCKTEKPDMLASVFPGRSLRKTGEKNDVGKYAAGIILIGSLV